jgi:hypothetical protein
MILVNGCSFTSGEESPIAWPSLIPNTVNIAKAGASNDYILRSTVDYIEQHDNITHVVIAWTSPHRIEINEKHLTASSQAKYGKVVDEVFKDWNNDWAFNKFLTQIKLMASYLKGRGIPYIFVSTFDIQIMANLTIVSPYNYLGWPYYGIVEIMGDCPKGPGGHPLELGHQRIADYINEHIRHLGWIS